ncbi:MAG: hypothetical protein JW795_11660 [Chitinivibrionales bacterium]|nr:hypothetical protein [Chitinivibrionales bacterium]
MKLNKLLRNPIMVIILCVTAAGFVYFNLFKPLTSSGKTRDSGGVNPETVQETAVETSDPEQANDPLQQQMLQLHTPEYLKRTGWKRQSGRDPFSVLSSKEQLPPSVTTPEIPNEINQQQLTARTKKNRSQNLLQAISIGPQGKIALLGNQIVREGDSGQFGRVVKIDPDSILLQGPQGLQILHFKKTTQETPQ